MRLTFIPRRSLQGSVGNLRLQRICYASTNQIVCGYFNTRYTEDAETQNHSLTRYFLII